MDIPEDVAAAQRAADQAWQAVEDYRKRVDADRRATAEPAADRWGSPVLRPWTPEEDEEFERLRQAAIAASEMRAAAMQQAGIVSTYDSEEAIRTVARGEA